MNKREITDVLEIASEFRPLIEAIFREVQSYGPLLRELAENLGDANAELTARQINKLVSLGCTREEALILTIDLKSGLAEALRRVEAKK